LGIGQYTDEFKVEAVRLSGSMGGSQAAKRLGIPESRLWNWIRLSRAGKLKAAVGAGVAVKRSVSEVEAKNARLRKELASTKLDLEIVKKAAAYFAKESREVRLDRRASRPIPRDADVPSTGCVA
jgi:transposase